MEVGTFSTPHAFRTMSRHQCANFALRARYRIVAHRTRAGAAASGVCLRTADEFSDHVALMVVEAVDHGYCVSLLPYFLMEAR